MRSVVLLLALVPAAALTAPSKAGVARHGPPPLLRLRGGSLEEPRAAPRLALTKASDQKRTRLYAMSAATFVGWFGLATVFFARSEGWPLAQSLFYAVDTGLSIGFGAVAEEATRTKMFTIVHVLLGASALGGVLALFAEAVVADASTVASAEYTGAALSAAFARADTSGDGQLGPDELRAALGQLGVRLDDGAFDATLKQFDANGDGSVSVAEFCAAIRPHLAAGNTGAAEDIGEAIRRAVAVRGENALARASRRVQAALTKQRTFLLFALWVGLGAVWGMLTEGWDAVTGIYFAVGGLSTGGLQAPSLTSSGTLPDASAIFVALWCLSGIPIFGFALGRFANIFVERLLAARERRALTRPIADGEYDFAEQLFASDGQVDLAEYLALELLRLGKVDMSTLELLKGEFDRRDKDKNGKLSRDEAKRV